MEIFRYSLEEEAVAAARTQLQKILTSQTPTLFLSSGGSALELLKGWTAPPNVTVGVVDERYSDNPLINNRLQLQATGFASGAVTLNSIPRQYETLADFTQRYEEQIRSWMTVNPYSKIIATFGIGVDGHTAGIFPYPEERGKFARCFLETDRLVAGYQAKGKNQFEKRVTITPALMAIINVGIIYAFGIRKKEAVASFLAKEGDPVITPARLLERISNLTLYVS